MKEFEIFTVSSLEKVFPGTRPCLFESENECFINETFSFQVAYKTSGTEMFLQYCSFEAESDIKEFINIRPVAPVLCTTPKSAKHDDYYLINNASLVPEILKEDKTVYIRHGEWNSLWVTVKGVLPIGRHLIKISIKTPRGNVLGEVEYTLNVLEARLPESDLNYAHWFHYDGIARYYGKEVFDDSYNVILDKYISNFAEHGANVLMVPLFTPPLNTAEGAERLTAQLVDVKIENGVYSFGFERVKSFMKNAEKLGVKKFEMSHFYSQWGAGHPPKIIAEENGVRMQIFGWKDDSLGERYVKFIKEFLIRFVKFLKKEGYDEQRCFFHISDEPSGIHIQRYTEIRNIIKPILKEYRICDALSEYSFYEKGAVDLPISVTDKATEFIDNGVKDLWVYYCCGQGYDYLSNRFISMPLQRIRILGFQLYINGCKGFLQWGYNYYNSALSERYINPFMVNDADGSFQSGDSFIVYPGKDGPLDSIRHEVMFDAIQDYRALKLLESKAGREKVIAFLKENGMEQNFTDYPKSALWHSLLRKKLNAMICENI